MALFKLSGRLADIKFDGLPPATVLKAKLAILNFLGGSLSGADSELALSEKRIWKAQGCDGACVVIGHRGRMSPLAAAAVNAAMGQVFLQEDCHEKTLSHPGVAVIPVVLAMGQAKKASGKEILEAAVSGYEAQGRIGKFLIRPGFPKNGLRPASFLAPFGAAAGAARVLGLDADGMQRALSIAANTVAGVMEFVNAGTPDICIQNCFAAKNGMVAAYMAANGLTGAPTIFEGRFGLGYALLNEACAPDALVSDEGYEIDDTFIKIHPGCGHVLPTAQAAETLAQRQRIDPSDVEKVTVGVSKGGGSFPGVDNQGPYSGTISAMMSHQFMVSAALVRGEVSIPVVKNFADPAINAFARKVFVVFDEEVERETQNHRVGARVTVTLKDGMRISEYQKDTPAQTREGVAARVKAYGRAYFSDARTEKILETADRLPELNDVNALMDLFESDVT
ncbi:MAG: MmgE/PrpD family protein [Clostridiales Family XIII bacterium]|jgi:2-methylcitrate dehydratase PrpD|nr:MmgE/PrpD family protein [Clostridiales Family XIII bacterium]